MFLAGRMVGPIQALRLGAARLGSGDLSQRIAVKTGDELEALADQFNAMAGQLQESYAGLEKKVEERTHELETRSRELAQSVGELRALGEVTQAVNSTLDLATVLSTIVAKAVELSGTEAGSIYVVDPTTQGLQLRASHGMSDELIAELNRHNVHGESEVGKTFMCNIILRTVDPRTTELRKPRKVEDLLIAARNNWTIGFDNFSWMSWEFSDTLCMIATGISSGSRTLYTDDEEHTFTVRRPVIFNGIPGDLTERSDLASRTIKLEIPRIGRRRTKADLEREFEEIWPGVFGALLDGLVSGLRDGRGIEVDDPARLMDFEQFAEAGCRAMGFEKWEFVDAYKANRHGSMVVAAEASAVGRAVMAFLKDNLEGFRGQMQRLYSRLGNYNYKGDTNWRDWPKSPTRLSTELSRLSKPLAAVGITCLTKVDRRQEGGTQKDVVLEWAPKKKVEVVEVEKPKPKEEEPSKPTESKVVELRVVRKPRRRM
jgi:HAMP domain-containing protein